MEVSSMMLGRDGHGSETGRASQAPGMQELDNLANLSLTDRRAGGSDDSRASVTDPVLWTLLDVLDLLRQYTVPAIDLQSGIGTVSASQRNGRHYSYTLGGGYSAIVLQHTTTEDVFEVATQEDVLIGRQPRLVTRSGTVVAFKKISPRPSANGESESRRFSDAFRSICREIEVYQHPLLQDHENIGRLLYVAWQRTELFPWMALELAAFGTLEDVLTAPGEGPTLKQKLNLTIDIALGVAALHKAGFVHGDLKPANILVQAHPERQILGQLSDFGGSALFDGEAPTIGTHLWLAPEACTACPSIDWRLADTWSFGLVVASIWCHEPHPQRTHSASYLQQLVHKLPDSKAKDTRILLLKTEHDSSPDSLISRCTTDFPSGVAVLLLLTLSSQSTRRISMELLVARHLSPLCAVSERRISVDYSHRPIPEKLPFKVWSPGYRGRSKSYHQMVFPHLGRSSSPLRAAMGLAENSFTVMAPEVDSGSSELLFLQDANPPHVWARGAIKAVELGERNTARHGRQAVVAFQVAVSHCCELGIQADDAELVTWTYTAAKGGHNNALWMAPLLEDSCDHTYEDVEYRRACLVIGSCIGSAPSLAALEREDSTLYEATRAAIRSRQRQDYPAQFSSRHLFKGFLSAPQLNPLSCTLIDALKSQNVDRAGQLLQDPSTDVTDVIDEAGRNVLHSLTFLDDKDTAGLAILACAHGADLHKVAILEEVTTLWLCRQPIIGTPIFWAAMKGMKYLFKELLFLHEETSSAIPGAYTMAMRVASLHHYDILKVLLERLKESPSLFPQENPFHTPQELLQGVLGVALTTADVFPVLRRLLHGSNHLTAKLQTIQVCLEAGARQTDLPCFGFEDVIQFPRGHDAIRLAMASDDGKSLELLFTHLGRVMHADEVLIKVCDSLVNCLYGMNLRCVRLLLDMFPQAATTLSTEAGQPGFPTPLNIAARLSNPGFALALLEKGADVSIEYKNFSSLARALCDGHVETAEVIYKFCSDDQRQKTFGYHPASGFSMSGRLMSIWSTNRKGRALVDAMKWLHEKNGAYFECEATGNHPVWTQILTRRASSSAEQLSLDNLMLATLFDLFPQELNRPDELGLYPIHYATMNGYREAIQILLNHGVNINVETKGGTQVPKSLTPLAIATQRMSSKFPPDVSAGGRVELRRWRETMKDIQKLLRERGATLGSNPSNEDTYRSMQHTVPRSQYVTMNQRDQDHETELGEDVWPKKLPKDETSTRENQRNGGELMTARTRNMLRALHGPLSGSEEEMSDEDKEEFARYRTWLVETATARSEKYKQHELTWDAVCQEQTEDPLPSTWDRWHSCSLKRIGLAGQEAPP